MIGVKCLLTGFFLLPFAVSQFNYDNPIQWPEKVPQCAGLRQSPIALEQKIAKPIMIYPIIFHNFNVPFAHPAKVVNNGNTVEIDIENTITGFHPFITGGGLDGVYSVEAVHFHWGSPQTKGSEHALGGQKYDLEMHIVSRNIKFASVELARNDPFGLAVMGVLFKGVNEAQLPRTGLNELVDLLPSMTKFGTKATLKNSLTMGSLMGKLNPNKFFTYRGSLTTPPCSQAVTWIVFEDVLPIQNESLQQFWKLLDDRGLPLVNNFRPLQLHNSRRIFSKVR